MPMPRHWHPVKFASIKVINVSYDGKMDSSVKHWNNTKGATRMTSSATYLDHKRRILKRKASRKSYAKSSIYGIYIIFMHIMVFIINGK